MFWIENYYKIVLEGRYIIEEVGNGGNEWTCEGNIL